MTYEPLIQSTIDTYQRWIDEVKTMNPHATLARKLAEQFPDEHYHSSASEWGVTVQMKFKNSDQLVKVLRWTRGRNYRVTSFTDNPETKSRTYEIKTVGSSRTYDWQHEIILKAFFDAEDGECKYVETGETKTIPAVPEKEIPILELRCGDAAIPVEV